MLKYEEAAMLDDATLRAIAAAKRLAQPVKPAPRQPIDWAALAARARTTPPTLLGD